ncbi:MAG: hypothetical protein JW760_13530, partial [Spirochaetales bacterium]|nr:hypothetical protein [Spirochaetales bacterium]
APEDSGSGPYGWAYSRSQYSAVLSAQAGYALPGHLDLTGYLQGGITGSGDLSEEVELSPYLRGYLSAQRSFPGHLTLSGNLGGTWTPDSPGITETNLSLSLGNLHSRYPGYLEYRGLSFKGHLDYRPGEALWKTGGVLSAAPAGFPLYGRIYGALSSIPVFSTQGALNFLSGAGYPVYGEFAGGEAVSSFYTGADVELRLFNLEVQRRVWFMPVFLNRVQMAAGYRAAWMGDPFFHSVFARAGMTFSPLVGSNARFHLTVRIEAAYSFTDRQFSFSLF